ncbi:uncharacterized protein LOC131466890 [Solea solea]|uniref:uncharacterized protein LOC131466890 n=1 Tax=Solea solea TaxID=90069 RepID=UPI00272DB48D|nr:uncharacterized protein LOC131466890 [Solea solea]
MAGEAGCCGRLPQTVAVILLMFSLALSISCFSLRGLGKNVQKHKVSEAAVMKERAGNILVNGNELSSEPGSSSVEASGNNDDDPHVDLGQSEDTELFAQESQLDEVMANKAAWELLNPTLRCGQTKMKFKAMGPGAADLQLDIGSGYSLPLNQVNENCGYSMQQNALGLVLVVPYDGCNVLQENGNYVVLMRWLNTPVKFTCPILQSIEETPDSVTLNPALHPRKLASHQKPWSMNRHKRQTPPSDPNSQYYLYLYYLNWLRTYYPYYYYYYYYYPYYNSLPATVPPATTTTAPIMTTTTAPIMTTNEVTPATTTTGPDMTTNEVTPATTTTGPNMTTTESPPPYYTFYYHPNAVPSNSDIFYYAIIQHFYGRDPMQTTALPPTSTAQPTDTATPSQSSPVTTTTAPTQQTTKRCSETTPTSSTSGSSTTSSSSTTTTTTTSSSSSNYPGPLSPYVNYMDQPFKPYVLFDALKKTGELPDDQKYMPSAGYKSGFQAQAYPNLYWQGVPWQNYPPIDWENLQPKQA